MRVGRWVSAAFLGLGCSASAVDRDAGTSGVTTSGASEAGPAGSTSAELDVSSSSGAEGPTPATVTGGHDGGSDSSSGGASLQPYPDL